MRDAASPDPAALTPEPQRGLRVPRRLAAARGARSPDGGRPDPVREVATLRHIVEGLDRLEEEVSQRRVVTAATARGYLTPDEEDRVRRQLLSYRNHRLAAYELICRHQDYAQRREETDRLHSFLLAFAAALTLYARSLRIIQIVEHAPVLRAKLNEPEPRCDLEPGFFDDVLAGYSSLSNYRLLREADRFWRSNRRRVARLGLSAPPDGNWMVKRICRDRWLVRQRLLHVLWTRLRLDSRAFRQTVFGVAREARYGLEAYIGTTFAQAGVSADTRVGIDDAVRATLCTRMQPGDILLMRTEKKLTTALLPGFWAHAAVYLGNTPDLEALGLQLAPDVRAAMEPVDRCGYVLEGVAPRVWITPLARCLVADHVLVLRPNLGSEDRRLAMQEALAHLGQPYDFEFDFTQTSRIVCTGLVYRAWHGRGPIRFELVKRLGRFTLSGDDLVSQALAAWRQAGEPHLAPFQLVALALHRRKGGVQFAPGSRIATVLGRLLKGWRPLRRGLEPTSAPPR